VVTIVDGHASWTIGVDAPPDLTQPDVQPQGSV